MRRLTFRVTEEMYEFLKGRGRVYGSVSGYLRHLVMNDMQACSGVAVRRVVERVVEEVVSCGGVTPVSGRFAPPRAVKPSGGAEAARVSGYGSLHAELMAELKSRFSSGRVGAGGSV